jgi:hypothetical protein
MRASTPSAFSYDALMKAHDRDSTREAAAGPRRSRLRFPLRMWLNYRFDEWVSGGFWRMFVVLSAVLVAGASVIAVARIGVEGDRAADGSKPSLGEAVWQTVFHSLDPGVIADEPNRSLRPVMMVATLLGLLILSTLIGVITTKIDARVAGLRRGRTPVCESDHVLILGWNSAIFDLLREIHDSAGASTPPRVVVLADRDNGEMADAVARFVDTERELQEERGVPPWALLRRPITRSGVPWDRGALGRVHPGYARWILVLTGEDDSDASVIKTLLCLDGLLPRDSRPPIVASVSSHQNVALAREAAGSSAEVVNADQTIARLLVQTARQVGVGAVIGNLTSFDGDELYSCALPAPLVGKTYRDAVLASNSHSVIGVETAGGPPRLLGGHDIDLSTTLQASDRLWVLAADSRDARTVAAEPDPGRHLDEQSIEPQRPNPEDPELVLIVGWNRRGRLVIDELDEQVHPGTTVIVFDPVREGQPEGFDRGLERARAKPRRNIREIMPLGVDEDMAAWIERFHREVRNLREFHSIIVLDDSDTAAVGVRLDLAVARVVLELRRLKAEGHGAWPRVVCEVADERTRELIRIEEGEEFIASGRFVSSLMTHYALDPRRVPLYENLFDAPSAELCTRPFDQLVRGGRAVNWRTVVESALRRREIAIGWIEPTAAGGFLVHFSPARDRLLPAESLRGRVVLLAERA